MVERNTVNLKDISDDQIVFDYVAGHLSEQERVRFEDDLRHNESLAKKVDSERELRRKLTEYERQAPALNADENAIEDLVIQINDFETNHKILSFIQQPKVYISAAACLMVAIAVSMFEPAPSSAPEFELLSNNKSVMTVDFDTLIESKQLAKLSLIGLAAPCLLLSQYLPRRMTNGWSC